MEKSQRIKRLIRKSLRSKLLWCMIILLVFIYMNNSSIFAKPQTGEPLLLAHRGLGQTFDLDGVTNDTCTATRIHPPDHPYLENTIAGMEAAFAAGADVVEFDVHPTTDGQFAVFHDWTLDCRTDGTGETRTHTLAELKKLDIGYGYSADGGKTYPFRGKGVGLMPSLDEVLETFPDQSFLIHIKSDDPAEGEQLAKHLSALSPDERKRLTVYGGDQPIAALNEHLPDMHVMSKASMKSCLLPYIAIGWTGIVPEACEQTQLHIPENIAPWLWGWPDRFLNRMDRVDTRVILVGDGGDFSSGFDTPQDLERLPSDYRGGIWTNRIDRVAPLLLKQEK